MKAEIVAMSIVVLILFLGRPKVDLLIETYIVYKSRWIATPAFKGLNSHEAAPILIIQTTIIWLRIIKLMAVSCKSKIPPPLHSKSTARSAGQENCNLHFPIQNMNQ